MDKPLEKSCSESAPWLPKVCSKEHTACLAWPKRTRRAKVTIASAGFTTGTFHGHRHASHPGRKHPHVIPLDRATPVDGEHDAANGSLDTWSIWEQGHGEGKAKSSHQQRKAEPPTAQSKLA